MVGCLYVCVLIECKEEEIKVRFIACSNRRNTVFILNSNGKNCLFKKKKHYIFFAKPILICLYNIFRNCWKCISGKITFFPKKKEIAFLLLFLFDNILPLYFQFCNICCCLMKKTKKKEMSLLFIFEKTLTEIVVVS